MGYRVQAQSAPDIHLRKYTLFGNHRGVIASQTVHILGWAYFPKGSGTYWHADKSNPFDAPKNE